MAQQRSFLLDFLKGIAIIAVIMYHLGIFKFGYLGVEVFFVISGFLTTKSIVSTYKHTGGFNFCVFLLKRIVRLFPLIVILCICTFVIAYFTQLPDNFKNTCETTVGTITFLNNIVQYITSGNYWDTSNDFKPLMHTWYLGVLFQFYLLYPLTIQIFCKSRVNYSKVLKIIIIWGGLASFLLFLLDNSSQAAKFFLFPYRYWEFAFGAYAAMSTQDSKKHYINISIFLICFLLCFNLEFSSHAYRLILTTIITVIIISQLPIERSLHYFKWSIIPLLGKASFSIYIWHQFIFAFYRYIFDAQLNIFSHIGILSASFFLGLTSYELIEQKFNCWMTKNITRTISILSINLFVSIILLGMCIHFYNQNGIVRDIPELSISKNNGQFQCQNYNARNNAFDINFPHNNKKNILVLGDSFARDWINILRESNVQSHYNISVHSFDDDVASSRAKQADIIFIANNGPFSFHKLMPEIANHEYYRIGHKYFGECNGNVYNNIRFKHSGFNQAFQYNDSLNINEHKFFGNHFIDLMSLIKLPNGQYPYFTPNHKFYSHDGIHLTQAGAQHFAHLLSINKLLLSTNDSISSPK